MDNIFYNAFQRSYDGICIIDKNGVGVAINESAERISGFSKEEFIGETILSALEKGLLSHSVTEIVLREKRMHTEVVSVRGVELFVTGNPIYDQQGEIAYIVLNVRDINELNNVKIDLLLSIALQQNKMRQTPFILTNKDTTGNTNIVSNSPQMKKVLHLVEKVSKVDSAVLILGESGVGKEVVVDLIHKNSPRSKQPLVKINCTAIPHHLLEAELFGYEKGAFTGADSQGKTGLFEEANNGTIFLDEIGDMPLDLQAKILRTLQEHEIRRVGGRKNIKVNIRVVSATNKNLKEQVQKGYFRQDLYYRLNIIPIYIPPLRERRDDIIPLAHTFLNRANQKYQLKKHFQPGVVELLQKHTWPGNIREMENVIERLAVTSEQDEITWSDLPFISDHPGFIENHSLKSTLEEVEKKILFEKMAMYKTTRKVAKVLGISQSSVVNKLNKYNYQHS